jgi:hypothetical protein
MALKFLPKYLGIEEFSDDIDIVFPHEYTARNLLALPW